jgi:hypothetical protein
MAVKGVYPCVHQEDVLSHAKNSEPTKLGVNQSPASQSRSSLAGAVLCVSVFLRGD